ncbi:MAG: hypothetical protein QMC83_10495, partial [Thermodesulfovibrionales bacterium]|nr:hypothetical protein [Thermodesulfovibrionales bacterium]
MALSVPSSLGSQLHLSMVMMHIMNSLTFSSLFVGSQLHLAVAGADGKLADGLSVPSSLGNQFDRAEVRK